MATAAADQARKIGSASFRAVATVGQTVGLAFVGVVLAGMWASRGFPSLSEDLRGRHRAQTQQQRQQDAESAAKKAGEGSPTKAGGKGGGIYEVLANPYALRTPTETNRGRTTPDYPPLPRDGHSISSDGNGNGDGDDDAEEEWATALEEVASVMAAASDGGRNIAAAAALAAAAAKRRAIVEGWRYTVEDAYRGS